MLFVQLYLLVGLIIVSINYKVLIDSANNPLFIIYDKDAKRSALYYIYPCICILFWPAIVIAVIWDWFDFIINRY